MRERDANTTGTNGCPRAQTRHTSSSAETAIYLDQRIRSPIRPHVTLSAHNPKVRGSNPLPATISIGRPQGRSIRVWRALDSGGAREVDDGSPPRQQASTFDEGPNFHLAVAGS